MTVDIDNIIVKLEEASLTSDIPKADAYEDLLAENLEILVENENFFSLPNENIFNIIKKSKVKDVDLLCKLFKSMSTFKSEFAPLIINFIDFEGSVYDYCRILSNLTKAPISKYMHYIVEKWEYLPNQNLAESNKELEEETEKLREKTETDEINIKSLKENEKKYHQRIKKYEKEIAKLREKSENDERNIKSLKENEKKYQQRISKLNSELKEIKKEQKTDLYDIFEAARLGSLSSVVKNIDKGVSVNSTDKYGQTALHIASCKGHFDIVKYLLEKGASSDMEDKYGQTALHLAADKGYLNIARILVNGRNINKKNADGATALHLAAYNGNNDIVNLLLKENANLDIEDNNGQTAFRWASDNSQTETMKLLISKGAKKDHIDKFGQTAYSSAKSKGILTKEMKTILK